MKNCQYLINNGVHMIVTFSDTGEFVIIGKYLTERYLCQDERELILAVEEFTHKEKLELKKVRRDLRVGAQMQNHNAIKFPF